MVGGRKFFNRQSFFVDQTSPQPFQRTHCIIAQPKNRKYNLNQRYFDNNKIKFPLLQPAEVTKSITIEKESTENGLQNVISKGHFTGGG